MFSTSIAIKARASSMISAASGTPRRSSNMALTWITGRGSWRSPFKSARWYWRSRERGMIKPRLILCGGVEVAKDDPLCGGRHAVELRTHGPQANVNVRLEDLAKVFDQHLSPRLEDLLEIAAYVYTADCATRRAGNW